MNPYIENNVERYRSWFDPISIIDVNVSSDWSSDVNPHSYDVGNQCSTN